MPEKKWRKKNETDNRLSGICIIIWCVMRFFLLFNQLIMSSSYLIVKINSYLCLLLVTKLHPPFSLVCIWFVVYTWTFYIQLNDQTQYWINSLKFWFLYLKVQVKFKSRASQEICFSFCYIKALHYISFFFSFSQRLDLFF